MIHLDLSGAQGLILVIGLILFGALLARWREVANCLIDLLHIPQPDPDDPYEDYNAEAWRMAGRRTFDGRATTPPEGWVEVDGRVVDDPR